jgi:hypothetical protein
MSVVDHLLFVVWTFAMSVVLFGLMTREHLSHPYGAISEGTLRLFAYPLKWEHSSKW